jgi:hypothetical protein
MFLACCIQLFCVAVVIGGVRNWLDYSGQFFLFDLEVGVIVEVLCAHFPQDDILDGFSVPYKQIMGVVLHAAAL